jgi:hypothetical protein
MKQGYGINPLKGGWGMEEVFNLLYSDAFPVRDDERALAPYWELVRLYYGVINKTTQNLYATEEGVRGLLEAVGDPADGIGFITFNHDIVVESSLQQAASGGRVGSQVLQNKDVYKLYRIEAKVCPIQGNKKPLLAASLPYAPILKFHGSLNWLRRVRNKRWPRNAIPRPTAKILCLDHYEARTGAEVDGYDVVPVIVPPIIEKSPQFTHLLGPIWEEAEKLLRNATRVIVFGYSLPDADVRAKALLRASLGGRGSLSEVVVINPDCSVVGKLARLLSGVAIRHYAGVRDFRASLTVD